ncbi:MAG TPA: hypothetical protein VFP80_18465 [Thermoanaerobaculia bacterium]|nr:hypothetical protein [Thermoanaerobaculia bacterium]
MTATRRIALLGALIVLAACASGPQSGTTSVPGRGALAVEIVPNPIRATLVSGTTYDFPFEVVLRETGGRPVTVTNVTATVQLPGGFPVAREAYDAERIRSLGYGTTVPANGVLRYRFAPRKEVPDERLFGGVSAQLRVEGADDGGTPASASTVVTITR